MQKNASRHNSLASVPNSRGSQSSSSLEICLVSHIFTMTNGTEVSTRCYQLAEGAADRSLWEKIRGCKVIVYHIIGVEIIGYKSHVSKHMNYKEAASSIRRKSKSVRLRDNPAGEANETFKIRKHFIYCQGSSRRRGRNG